MASKKRRSSGGVEEEEDEEQWGGGRNNGVLHTTMTASGINLEELTVACAEGLEFVLSEVRDLKSTMYTTVELPSDNNYVVAAQRTKKEWQAELDKVKKKSDRKLVGGAKVWAIKGILEEVMLDTRASDECMNKIRELMAMCKTPLDFEYHVNYCKITVQTQNTELANITFGLKQEVVYKELKRLLVMDGKELPGVPPPGYHEHAIWDALGGRKGGNKGKGTGKGKGKGTGDGGGW
jgi:hypothetical protein